MHTIGLTYYIICPGFLTAPLQVCKYLPVCNNQTWLQLMQLKSVFPKLIQSTFWPDWVKAHCTHATCQKLTHPPTHPPTHTPNTHPPHHNTPFPTPRDLQTNLSNTRTDPPTHTTITTTLPHLHKMATLQTISFSKTHSVQFTLSMYLISWTEWVLEN